MSILHVDELQPPAHIRFVMNPDFQMCSRDLIEAGKSVNRGYASTLYRKFVSSPEKKKHIEQHIGLARFPGLGPTQQPVISIEGADILSRHLKFEAERYDVIMRTVREYVASVQSPALPPVPEEAPESRKRKWSVSDVPRRHPGAYLSVLSVMHELGFIRATQEDAIDIGTAVAERFREKHQKYPPFHENFVRGRLARIYRYCVRDLDLVQAEILRRASGAAD